MQIKELKQKEFNKKFNKSAILYEEEQKMKSYNDEFYNTLSNLNPQYYSLSKKSFLRIKKNQMIQCIIIYLIKQRISYLIAFILKNLK